MKNKISHSAVALYSTCARKYYYHYKLNLRGKTISGALIMGSAIDAGLNELLTSKDLSKSILAFDKAFTNGFINDKKVNYKESDQIVYAAKDFDNELLLEEDLKELPENYLDDEKPSHLANWLCLRRKGHIMLKSYFKEILPNIKNVISSQKKIVLNNDQGDEITGYIDAIIEWKDGKNYIVDHKTSTWEYEDDSAGKSQQLIIYYHSEKEQYKLSGVGFIVMYKAINKNRTKVCKSCGFDGSGSRHKTCNNERIFVPEGETLNQNIHKPFRCNGEWTETINPECRIVTILNQVEPAAEDLVIETFDQANEGIKKEAFGPNLDACFKYGSPCQFYKKCWEGKDDELVTVKGKKK